jgi:hypothetical protein
VAESKCSLNVSLKISETITPRKLIFCRNVLLFGLLKLYSRDYRIPYIFQTGSGKPEKIAKV